MTLRIDEADESDDEKRVIVKGGRKLLVDVVADGILGGLHRYERIWFLELTGNLVSARVKTR
jgi:hypothetical protein